MPLRYVIVSQGYLQKNMSKIGTVEAETEAECRATCLKCMSSTRGIPVDGPRRRYAKETSPTWTVWSGAVSYVKAIATGNEAPC